MPPKTNFLTLTNPSARAQNAYSLLPDSDTKLPEPMAKAAVAQAKSNKPAEGKPAPAIGKSKAKATPDITAARKKTKLVAGEVVPATASPLAPVPRYAVVHLFMEPNTAPITCRVQIADCERFEFSSTHLSNAEGTPPILYEPYSPYRDELTSAADSSDDAMPEPGEEVE
ncbi:hypothetical protein FB451DRAFT_1414475 [Mycena latifolia]|nr:hypothetical protein FB451DRAFT_1414475 [Mycena latifolia]